MGRWGFFVGVSASGTEIWDVNIGGFGSVWSGDWARVLGFVDRYGGVLGQTSDMLILQGVSGLGPEIGNVNILEGVRGQRLWIYILGVVVPFGGFGDRHWGMGMLISGGGGGGAGSKTDMGNVHIMGVGEFWDRHWRC